MRAGLLERLGQRDVRLFVEAGPELDAYRDFLAGAGRRDERVHERRLRPGAVQRLLDGQHVGVGGGLADEVDHRGERLEGVVQKDVAGRDRLEDAGGAAPSAPGGRG